MFEDAKIWLRVGGNVRLLSRNNYFILLQADSQNEPGLQNDYDGGVCSDDVSLSKTNTMMIMRGHPEYVRIGFKSLTQYLHTADRIVKVISPEIFMTETRQMWASAKSRWFGHEKLKEHHDLNSDAFFKKQAKLLASAYYVHEKWLGMNDNPGRQFTASFHPIAEIGSWYNSDIHRPIFIGISHKVWATLKCAQRRKDGPLGILTRDALRLICNRVWLMMCDDARRLIIDQ